MLGVPERDRVLGAAVPERKRLEALDRERLGRVEHDPWQRVEHGQRRGQQQRTGPHPADPQRGTSEKQTGHREHDPRRRQQVPVARVAQIGIPGDHARPGAAQPRHRQEHRRRASPRAGCQRRDETRHEREHTERPDQYLLVQHVANMPQRDQVCRVLLLLSDCAQGHVPHRAQEVVARLQGGERDAQQCGKDDGEAELDSQASPIAATPQTPRRERGPGGEQNGAGQVQRHGQQHGRTHGEQRALSTRAPEPGQRARANASASGA